MKLLITRGREFRFSDIALKELKDQGVTGIQKSKGGFHINCFHPDDWRTHKKAIQVVEKLGQKASARYSALKVVEIPDDVEYYIEDKQGVETVHEKHRVWE